MTTKNYAINMAIIAGGYIYLVVMAGYLLLTEPSPSVGTLNKKEAVKKAIDRRSDTLPSINNLTRNIAGSLSKKINSLPSNFEKELDEISRLLSQPVPVYFAEKKPVNHHHSGKQIAHISIVGSPAKVAVPEKTGVSEEKETDTNNDRSSRELLALNDRSQENLDEALDEENEEDLYEASERELLGFNDNREFQRIARKIRQLKSSGGENMDHDEDPYDNFDQDYEEYLDEDYGADYDEELDEDYDEELDEDYDEELDEDYEEEVSSNRYINKCQGDSRFTV